MNGPHTASADAVQQQVVDIVGLQVLKATLEHCLSLLEVILRGREVREFRSDEVVATLIAACFEGYAEAFFAFTPTVGRRRVEVVDAVVEGVFAKAVHLFLIYFVATRVLLCTGTAIIDGRQSHPSISEQAYLVALLRIGAIGHFVCRDRTIVVSHVIDFAVIVSAFHAAGCQRCRCCCGA